MKKDDVNILLISPSSMPLYQQEELLQGGVSTEIPRFETPTGLIELASFVRGKNDNLKFEILDCAKDLYLYGEESESRNKGISYEEFYINELNNVSIVPDIVGVSILFSSSYLAVLELMKYIRSKWKDAVIVLGGGHVTFYCFQVFKDSDEVDFIFAGESELSFYTFVSGYLESGKFSANCKGIYDRKKSLFESESGKIKADFGEVLENLDEIGLPAYDLLDLDNYKKFASGNDSGSIGVMMDRGCPFKCTYCASMIIHGSSIRSKSNERIIDDLLYLRDECGFNNIILWDDLFAARKKKFMSLSKEIVERGVNDGLTFYMPSGLSVRVMNFDLLDSIFALGFGYVRIMIESGSEYSQEHLIKKKVDLDKARELISYSRNQGVRVETNILFGFPGETKEYMQQTIDYIKTIDIDWIQVFVALPLPGTEMFDQFAEVGLVDPQNIDWDRCGYASRQFDSEDITSQELTDLVYDVNIYTNFFGNRNFLQERYQRAADYFTDMVLNSYPFHIVALYMRSLSYDKLGKDDLALRDLQLAVDQINTSEAAQSLFVRYGSEMDSLYPYLDKSTVDRVQSVPPSVQAGFVL